MDLTKKEPRRPRWQFGPRWAELCVVGLATVATGFITGRVSENGSQVDAPQPTTTITVQATQTVTATPDPSAAPEDTDQPLTQDAQPGESSSARPARVYLADLDAVDYRGDYEKDPVVMSGKPYPRSIRLGCETNGEDSITYNTSGYKRLRATLGIPSDTDNAIGSVAQVKVFGAGGEQLGKAVEFRSSHTAGLDVDISGQDQIMVSCALLKSGDPDRISTRSGLGDAVLTS
jgi:hypothetical protein